LAKVRHSRLSRNSALGMIILGLFTFLFFSELLGMVLALIGATMYWFYRRQTKVALEGGEGRVEKGAVT